MRKCTLIFAIALAAYAADASALDINVTEPGTFKEIMIDTEEDVSTLTINGTMNAADVEYLTGNVGKIAQVQHLIIGDLKLVESETEPYRSFSIFAEAGGGESAKCYYSQNARVEAESYTTGLGTIGVIYKIYGTDLAGLLALTKFPKITLPANATKVPDFMCFKCFETQDITMSDNVEEIGKQAFYWCNGMTSINIPSKLQVIGERAFESTNLSSFTLPDNLIEIKKGAFKLCRLLESINLDKATSVGDEAFYQTKIKNVNLSNASSIGRDAFQSCPVQKLILSDKLIEIGDGSFAYPNSNNESELMSSLELPEGLERIGEEAFSNTKLKNVNIPSTVTYIGNNAFWRTPWDSSLNAGAVNGVVYVGNIAYKTVNNAENIVFRDGTLSISANFNMQYVKSLTLPSSVRSIYASGESSNLENVVFNEGLQIIGDGVCIDCPKLKEITLPSTLEYIGTGAFYNAGITSLTLPEGLKVIKGHTNSYRTTFGNTKITNLTLPYSLEELGSDTFGDCQALSTVRLNSRNLNYTGYSRDKYGHYAGGFLLGSGVEKIVIGAEVENIPAGLFGSKTKVSRVVFEESGIPLSIGNYALLAPNDAPAKVTGSFDRIVSLGDDAIGYLAFPSGTHFDLSNFMSIGKYAFNNIQGVSYLTFGKDMSITAPVGSFEDVRIINFDVPNVVIPKPYTMTNTRLVDVPNPMDSLIIGPNVEFIGEELFGGVSPRSIIFTPRNQTRSASTLSIGKRAFGYNLDLTAIDFPPELVSLGDYAIYELENLSSAYFHGENAPEVGNQAFQNKATLYVPAESEEAYQANMWGYNVVPYKLESVVFDKSALKLAPGESDYLVARITPAECSEMNIIWSSSDPTVATVNERGDVVAVNLGQATITATIAMDNSFKAECIVNVYDPSGVDSIDVDNESPIEEYYTLDGVLIEQPTAKGIYIAKHSDGTTSKVLMK